MNLYESKRMIIKLIDDFSSDNNITTDNDVKVKMNDFINEGIIEASQWKKIEKRFSILQNIPKNEISQNTKENSIHENKDITIKATGKCYSFYVNETASIVISQAGMPDIFINHAGDREFVRYKGITTGNGEIAIVFSGKYQYMYKDVAIFNVNYADSDKIPNFTEYAKYDLPKNYHELNSVRSKSGRMYEIKNKQILINGYVNDEIDIYYTSFGTKIPENITEAEEKEFVFDLDEDVVSAMLFYVAYLLTMTDSGINGSMFYQIYMNKLEKIKESQNKTMVTINTLYDL